MIHFLSGPIRYKNRMKNIEITVFLMKKSDECKSFASFGDIVSGNFEGSDLPEFRKDHVKHVIINLLVQISDVKSVNFLPHLLGHHSHLIRKLMIRQHYIYNIFILNKKNFIKWNSLYLIMIVRSVFLNYHGQAIYYLFIIILLLFSFKVSLSFLVFFHNVLKVTK